MNLNVSEKNLDLDKVEHNSQIIVFFKKNRKIIIIVIVVGFLFFFIIVCKIFMNHINGLDQLLTENNKYFKTIVEQNFVQNKILQDGLNNIVSQIGELKEINSKIIELKEINLNTVQLNPNKELANMIQQSLLQMKTRLAEVDTKMASLIETKMSFKSPMRFFCFHGINNNNPLGPTPCTGVGVYYECSSFKEAVRKFWNLWRSSRNG